MWFQFIEQFQKKNIFKEKFTDNKRRTQEDGKITSQTKTQTYIHLLFISDIYLHLYLTDIVVDNTVVVGVVVGLVVIG